MSPVFDEAKYRALLEKLEISEVKLKETYIDTQISRFDAEFYKKEYSAIEKKIRSFCCKTLKQLNAFSDCSAFYPSVANDYNFSANGIPFLRVNEIIDGGIVFSANTAFLPRKLVEDFSDSIRIAHNKDILIAKGGNTAGKVGYITGEYDEYATCRDVVILRTDGVRECNSQTLSLYLQSYFGKCLIEKTISQTGQPHLTLSLLDRLPVPTFSKSLQEKIKCSVDLTTKYKKEAIIFYNETEQLLLQELGLDNWQPTEESIATKSFRNAQTAGRLDAEYYQPKYKEIVAKLEQYGCGTISCESTIVNAMTKLSSGTEYPYVELADIGNSGEIISCSKDLAENLPSRAKQIMRTDDVIVSSVEGSLSSCALVTNDYNNAICSTGFHVLRSTEINPETLLVLMKSWPIQALLKQGCSGTILTAISSDALAQIKLPLIKKDVQRGLAAKIQESFALRKESKRLLDLAKRAVELAIEQSEDAAFKLLEKEGND